MRIAVLSQCGLLDLPVIEAVQHEFEDVTVLKVVGGPRSRRPPLGDMIRRQPHRVAGLAVRRPVDRWRAGRNQERLRTILAPDGPEEPAAEPLPAADVNGAVGVHRIRALRPDVLVTSSAPILRPEVFELPRLGTVNLHRGISPEYRGEHTVFYPLYRRDYDHIGVTLHYIDAGVDSGHVIAHGHPAIEPTDDELRLTVKCARLGARLLVEFLHRSRVGPVPGAPQAQGGHLIYRRDRRLRHDAAYALRRTLLRERPPPRPQLVTWH